MYVTYQDFFLFCTFIVALISLLYQIFKGKKQPPLLPIVTADCLQQKFKLIVRGRAASMAFPFSMLNIAHLAAGFKSQTHVYCNVVVKAVCCPFILLSGDSTFQNTHRNTPQAHISQFKGIDGIFIMQGSTSPAWGKQSLARAVLNGGGHSCFWLSRFIVSVIARTTKAFVLSPIVAACA